MSPIEREELLDIVAKKHHRALTKLRRTTEALAPKPQRAKEWSREEDDRLDGKMRSIKIRGDPEEQCDEANMWILARVRLEESILDIEQVIRDVERVFKKFQ